jgi:hypothetical protein
MAHGYLNMINEDRDYQKVKTSSKIFSLKPLRKEVEIT